MSEKFKDLIEKIETMSVLDLHELVRALEEKFGVSAQGSGPLRQSDSEASEAKEEQNTFTAVLASAGEQKIAVMKIVKEVLGLGLKDAKDLVDAAPGTLKAGMKKAEAEELKKKIETAGGKVELK
ncbi:MAG: large subunit ribosomal protein L7/L12 [Parcubacteria group bacterium Gr01-1014_24]|nr:MAG: large subunit ribosomal protein L7/L12 [Parcubacteria group bacterium Gr01-1014_24]